jgi:hypothetical protein
MKNCTDTSWDRTSDLLICSSGVVIRRCKKLRDYAPTSQEWHKSFTKFSGNNYIFADFKTDSNYAPTSRQTDWEHRNSYFMNDKIRNERIHVIWRGFSARIFQCKGRDCFIFWVCVCSHGHSACNADAPYFICGLCGCTIYFHIIS